MISRSVPDSLEDLNALPFDVREQLYVRLIPEELFTRFGIDRRTLRDEDGEHLVRITAPDGSSWARVELRARATDVDPVLHLDIGMSAFAVPELTFVQIADPIAPRYAIDRDETGQDTLLGTQCRNIVEETRALSDGLAPGQVRRGLRMLGRVLESVDAFCTLLGREFYLLEPLFYHSAVLYERQGCDYFIGRDRMDEIHAGFLPGGPLLKQLDGSTPFRCAGGEASARGRSWAIHDGILGAPFAASVRMFRVPGRVAGVSTFPGGAY